VNDARTLLVERIRAESKDLDRSAQRVQSSWSQGSSAPRNQDIYLDSVALNLHSFYTGVERLFELIVRYLDGVQPGGANWHRDLLVLVSREVAGRRPAVISAEVATALDEFRRFRHLVRNVYTANLVPDRIHPLVLALPRLWRQLGTELQAFADFLEKSEADW
jgi:hypothetical protein